MLRLRSNPARFPPPPPLRRGGAGPAAVGFGQSPGRARRSQDPRRLRGRSEPACSPRFGIQAKVGEPGSLENWAQGPSSKLQGAAALTVLAGFSLVGSAGVLSVLSLGLMVPASALLGWGLAQKGALLWQHHRGDPQAVLTHLAYLPLHSDLSARARLDQLEQVYESVRHRTGLSKVALTQCFKSVFMGLQNELKAMPKFPVMDWAALYAYLDADFPCPKQGAFAFKQGSLSLTFDSLINVVLPEAARYWAEGKGKPEQQGFS